MDKKKKLFWAGLVAIVTLIILGFQLKRTFYPSKPSYNPATPVDRPMRGPGMLTPGEELPETPTPKDDEVK